MTRADGSGGVIGLSGNPDPPYRSVVDWPLPTCNACCRKVEIVVGFSVEVFGSLWCSACRREVGPDGKPLIDDRKPAPKMALAELVRKRDALRMLLPEAK